MLPDSPARSLAVIDPVSALAAAHQRKDIIVQMMKEAILRPDIDYGTIPGSKKPSLYKPGAERLCAAFNLAPHFDTLTAIEQWDATEPLFFYRILCRLIHVDSGLVVATGIGSCNSRESKYRYRWLTEDKLPAGLDKAKLEKQTSTIREFAFAVDRAETTGQYGKPAAYWQQFKDAIANGTAQKIQMPTKKGTSDGWEIGGTTYRIPNDDIFSLVNTIDKMATKRALIAATLIGANASEFFTQDVEDLAGFGVSEDVVEGSYTVVKPEAPQISAEDAAAKLGQNGNDRIPGKRWTGKPLSAADLHTFFARAENNLTLSKGDVKRLLDLENIEDLGEWEQKFSTMKEAGDLLMNAHEAEMSASKPATPKHQIVAGVVTDVEGFFDAMQDLHEQAKAGQDVDIVSALTPSSTIIEANTVSDEEAIFGKEYNIVAFETRMETIGKKEKAVYWLLTATGERIKAYGRHGLFDKVGFSDEDMVNWDKPGFNRNFSQSFAILATANEKKGILEFKEVVDVPF